MAYTLSAEFVFTDITNEERKVSATEEWKKYCESNDFSSSLLDLSVEEIENMEFERVSS